MTNLDYYLTEDHAARQRTTLICVAVGAVLGLILQALGFSVNVTAIACFGAAGAVEFGRALTYRQESRKIQRAKPVLSHRRYVLQGAFAAVILAVLSLLRIPRAEAAIIERKLRDAASQDPPEYEKIRNLIDFARQNSLPLNPAAIDATRKQVARTLPPSPFKGSEASDTLARLDGYVLYDSARIALELPLPVLSVPVGEYAIHAPVYGRATSLIGADRNATKLVSDFAYSTQTPGVLLYGRSVLERDVLITHVTATWSSSNFVEKPFFLVRLPDDRTNEMAVFDVTVANLRQALDRIIWVGVLFEHCRIIYAGGWLQLAGVTFRECEFVAENEQAAKVLDFIKQQGQNPVTLRSR